MRHHKSLPTLAIFLIAFSTPIWLGTTCSQQELAPGPYQGDTLLARYDEVIIGVNDTFKDVIALADRNPAVVAARPELADKIEQLRAEFDGVPEDGETLVRLIRARNAYVATRTALAGQQLEGELNSARVALETARSLLPLFVQSQP